MKPLKTLLPLLTLVASVAAPGQAMAESWYLVARGASCVGLRLLQRMEKLDTLPDTPEAFAEQMRARGEQVTIDIPDGFPEDMRGQVVRVSYGQDKAPIFATGAVCRKLDQGG